jgi:hypothetical protein
VDPSFWSELASRKLDEYKLSEAPVDVTGAQRRGLGAVVQFGSHRSNGVQQVARVGGRMRLLHWTAWRRTALRPAGAAALRRRPRPFKTTLARAHPRGPRAAGYLAASRHGEVPGQVLVMGASFGGPGAWSAQASGGGAEGRGRALCGEGREGSSPTVYFRHASLSFPTLSLPTPARREAPPPRHTPPFSGPAQGSHALPGVLINKNTIEGFKDADKKALLQQAGGRGNAGNERGLALFCGPRRASPWSPALRGSCGPTLVPARRAPGRPQAGARVWADILGGAAEAAPALLSRFLVLAFGDLKKYVFTYWCARAC